MLPVASLQRGSSTALLPSPPTTARTRTSLRLPLLRRRADASPGQALAPACGVACEALYQTALELARQKDYASARQAFLQCVECCPGLCRAWVSWAQMEKKSGMDLCRQVLQAGLTANPASASIIQAWGLLELQRGNLWAAVLLLERSVQADPSKLPVLRWQIVQLASAKVATMSGRKSRRLREGGDAQQAVPRGMPSALPSS